MNIWKEFHGPNSGYILDLFDRYKEISESVVSSTKALFDLWKPEDEVQLELIS